MASVAKTLSDSGSRVWEVWRVGGEVVGVIYFTNIVPGGDATGHYIFFDEKLRDKTEVLNEIMAWAFEDHPEEGWIALRRITIEIPDHASALVRHAHKRLGFGGPFRHVLSKRTFQGKEVKSTVRVEGVKKNAVLWRGEFRDLIILGLQNPESQRRDTSPNEITQLP